MDWQIATQTHRGNARRINEDALLVERRYPLLVVADGMGGHEAGDVASRMLVDTLGVLDLSAQLPQAQQQVEAAITHCNASMIDYGVRRLAGQTIGSTVVVMLADDSRGICIWAGDSRLYRARGAALEQLTSDHSYVAELVRTGQISAVEALHHPSSNVITRAVGAATSLRLDSTYFDLLEGDSFLLCSDGLYNETTSTEILSAMTAGDILDSSGQLLQLCLGRPARDNVSFIVARPISPGTEDLDATLTYYPGGE
jgi:protein phosphatase